METRLKYLKHADFQEQRISILPKHPFFVIVSFLSVDTEMCLYQSFSSVCGHRSVFLSEFLFWLWTQECVFVRVSLLSVDTEAHEAYEIFFYFTKYDNYVT
jgi:hypothetical protein